MSPDPTIDYCTLSQELQIFLADRRHLYVNVKSDPLDIDNWNALVECKYAKQMKITTYCLTKQGLIAASYLADQISVEGFTDLSVYEVNYLLSWCIQQDVLSSRLLAFEHDPQQELPLLEKKGYVFTYRTTHDEDCIRLTLKGRRYVETLINNSVDEDEERDHEIDEEQIADHTENPSINRLKDEILQLKIANETLKEQASTWRKLAERSHQTLIKILNKELGA